MDIKKSMHLPYFIKLQGLTREEKVFIWLLAIIGVPQCDAFMMAFHNSNASRQSAAAMSSRLAHSPHIMKAAKLLHDGWSKGGGFDWNPNVPYDEMD